MLYRVMQGFEFDGVAYRAGEGIELEDLHAGLRLLGQIVEPTTAEAVAAAAALAEAAAPSPQPSPETQGEGEREPLSGPEAVHEAPAEVEAALEASPVERVVRGRSKRLQA